ncbi:hypothetical protein DXA95_04520 [Odoribacter sp. OF09-27XD]|nr:hypothetical protein [Odoribacter sp. OF09-27XD]RHV96939.1 hypothetical protein DXA95_04520 [Odoribacter sp. OF09-27XD]
MKNENITVVLEKIASIIKNQGEACENIFKNQVELINKQVDIINRQIDIIEKQHQDNVTLTQKLIETTKDK